MKKNLLRILAAGLCLCLMIGFVGCGETADPTEPSVTDPTDPPVVEKPKYDEATNTWFLYTKEDLDLLRQHPDANFEVREEIDCQGMVWTPVENFTGKLSGVWGGDFNHTISNLVIEAPAGATAAGFFGTVEGTVTDLSFENVTLKLPEGFSGKAGLLAGVIKTDMIDIDARGLKIELAGSNVIAGGLVGELEGKSEACYIDGEIVGTLAGGENAVGSFAGITKKDFNDNESRVNLSFTVNGKGSIGGLIGSVEGGKVRRVYYLGKINVTAGDGEYAVATLVGALNGTLQNGYNCAREFNVTGTKVTLGDYVAAQGDKGSSSKCYTRDMTNLIAAENMSAEERALRQKVVDYMYKNMTIPWTPATTMIYDDSGSCSSNHKFTFEAGKTYFGLPYTHKGGSLEEFMEHMTENGVLDTSRLPQVGYNGWDFSLGNDCADAMYWAWSQISPSIRYLYTKDMVIDLIRGEWGLVPVGDYVFPEFYNDPSQPTTREIITANNMKIFESYAKLLPGDGVLVAPGHSRLIAEVPVIIYDQYGNIDGKSYVVTHEQGQGNFVGTHCSGVVYRKCTFNELMTGGYIPITVQELKDGKAGEPTVTHDVTGTTIADLMKGYFVANYRINGMTVTIADTEGKIIATEKIYPCDGGHNFAYGLDNFQKVMDLSAIEAGKHYQCTVTMHLGDQDIVALSGDFTG